MGIIFARKCTITAKNLKDKVGLDDANAHETSVNNENELLEDLKTEKAETTNYEDITATMFLPMIDLNANIVNKEVQHHSDGTPDDYNGRANDLSDVVKLEIENNRL